MVTEPGADVRIWPLARGLGCQLQGTPVRFVDSLPRTETGKLLKSELKAADTNAS